MFWVQFACSKCEMPLQGWTGSKPNLVLLKIQLDEGKGTDLVASAVVSSDGRI